MARYSIAFSKAAVTAAGAIVDVAAAASDRGRIVELGWTVAAMTGTTPAASIGLSRSTAVGTRTTPASLLPEDTAEGAATLTSATAWSVAPTLAAAPMRRLSVNAIGAGIVWTWPPSGLVVPLSGSVVLHAVTVTGTTPSFTIDGYIVVDE